MNVLTGNESVTLLDIADRLLDTGVVLDGEATISVADVDLIYLGLNVALTSVDRMRRMGPGTLADQVTDRSARNVPSGPGAMSAHLYGEGSSEDPAPPVRASQDVIERSEAARPAAAERGGSSAKIGLMPERVNVDPDEVERGLAKLVLTIVEFVRQLLERQAVRRMQHGTLTEEEVERVGIALERLDTKMTEMASRFGLRREELSMKLGPLGDLV